MDSFQTTWAPLLYLVAGILFILALRGLSSPATSRAGNRNGMIGMAIAVGTRCFPTPVHASAARIGSSTAAS